MEHYVHICNDNLQRGNLFTFTDDNLQRGSISILRSLRSPGCNSTSGLEMMLQRPFINHQVVTNAGYIINCGFGGKQPRTFLHCQIKQQICSSGFSLIIRWNYQSKNFSNSKLFHPILHIKLLLMEASLVRNIVWYFPFTKEDDICLCWEQMSLLALRLQTDAM